MGRGRDFRGGGKGRGYHAEESDAPAAPSVRHRRVHLGVR
jgi:hypothetical protein